MEEIDAEIAAARVAASPGQTVGPSDPMIRVANLREFKTRGRFGRIRLFPIFESVE